MPRPLTVNWDTIRTLVMVHGPRETARRTGINVNTIMARAHRLGWKKEIVSRAQSLSEMSPVDALAATLSEAKQNSTLSLATYTEKATRAAAKHKQPLEIARKVRDVSAVYGQLWPSEKVSEIISAEILLKPDAVLDVAESEAGGGELKESEKSQKRSRKAPFRG